MDVGNQYCSKNLNFSVTISTYISSALHENTLPYSCATCYHLGEGVLVVCQQLHLHFYTGPRFIFFFHKKITHPLISKIIRHNDKTCTLIFKVLKVQKLMIYLVVILKERKRRQLMLML